MTSVRDRPGFTPGCGGCENLANSEVWQSGMAALVVEDVVAWHLGQHLGTVPCPEPFDDIRQPHPFRHPEHCSACQAYRRYRTDAKTWDGSW